MTDRIRNSRSEPDARKQLCEQVFTHPYFKNKNEMWFDPDREDFLADIVKKHSNISKILYTKSRKPRKYCPSFRYHACTPAPENVSKRLSAWEKFYEDKPDEFKKCFAWCRFKATEYSYVNAPTERKVHVANAVYSERVFICPVLKEDNILFYFVSDDDYDVNEADDNNEIIEYIPGKCIFSLESSSKLTVKILAEDTGHVTNMMQIEMFFLRRDVNQTPG